MKVWSRYDMIAAQKGDMLERTPLREIRGRNPRRMTVGYALVGISIALGSMFVVGVCLLLNAIFG